MRHSARGPIREAIANFPRRYYLLILAVLLLLVFKESILPVLLVVLLMVLAILSTLSSKLIQFNLGIELITFTTVVIAFAYSPIIALPAAILMALCASVLQGRIACPYNLSRYGIYTVLCILVVVFSGLEVGTAGKILTVVYNTLLGVVYAMTGFGLMRGSVPISVNVFLNLFLFSTFAGPLVHVLA